MSLLRPLPIRSDRFTNTEDKLVIEHSDLGGDFERVWDDSADVGLTVVYPNDREVVYAVEETFTRDGDVMYWDLVPASPMRSYPWPRVQVVND